MQHITEVEPSPAAARPPGFDDAVRRIREVVGEEHVQVEGEAFEERARYTIPASATPLAYVFPASTEEVQGVVRIANELDLRLWASSTGRNFGYGTATPAAAGTLVMVMERMNRIHEVNDELAYAVIEPGVSYRQLNQHLQDRGYTLWTDCTDGPPDGSVIGNALEKGVGETPYGDHFGNLCGLEVVLPTGERMETGGGPTGNNSTFHTYKWGTGPYLEGIFAQSNYGVVTRAGVWLMPAPEEMLSFTFGLHRVEDLGAVIDVIRGLALKGILRTKLHMINDYVTFTLITQYPWDELEEGETRLSDAALARLREHFCVPIWSFGSGLYGTREQVAAMRKVLVKELAPYGRLQFLSDRRVKFVGERFLPRMKRWLQKPVLSSLANFLTRTVIGRSVELMGLAPHIHAMLRGVPSDYFVKHAYFRSKAYPEKPAHVAHPARDRIGLIWFAPIIPMTGRDLDRILGILEPLHREHGFDFYVALLVVNPRSMVVLLQFLYDKEDADEAARAQALYDACREGCLEAGYQQYRTSVTCDPILDCNPEFKAAAERVKRALDPKGILAPGRYGIAPAE